MKKIIIILITVILIISYIIIIKKDNLNVNKGSDNNMTESMTATINDKEFNIILEDNKTVKELMKMLPLEVLMNELNGNEKYYYLEKTLPTDSKRVEKIQTGDVMLFGNNCLVIFYESFKTSYSYTRIGRIENIKDLKDSLGKGNVIVKLERNEK